MNTAIQTRQNQTRALVESAVMIALATALSIPALISLPYGGSVTIASLLPIVLISYRNGIRWGLGSGLVFGVIQQLLGLKNLTYVTGWQSVVAVILLDYLIAFTMLGLGGVFRKSIRHQAAALVCGSVLGCLLRYLCHVISGATVWAGLSIPTNAALLYSLAYNATYMIPETIVLVITAYFIGSLLDFRGDEPIRLAHTEKKALPVLKWVAILLLSVALIFDVAAVFSHLQNHETGTWDLAGLSQVNWTAVIIVSAVAAVASAVLFLLAFKAVKKEEPNEEPTE